MSAAFLEALRGSHTMTAQAIAPTGFQSGVDPDGVELPILAGEVVLDGTADIRGSLNLTTEGAGMWPVRASDPLAPYGSEVFCRRGLQFGNGTTEWVSLGYYQIQNPSQANPPDGPIIVEAKDRMAGIVAARLVAPIQFQASVTYGALMNQLVTEVYPLAVIEWDDATETETIDRSLIVEELRFEFLDDLVSSLGKVWYWDHRGHLVIHDQASATTPVWDVNAGENGVLVKLSRQLTRERVYNAVVAFGEATDTAAPVRAVAIDADSTSPTYFHGPFGPVPRFYSSPFLITEAQCASAAEAMLLQGLGLPYNVDFSAIPNPALEPFDPVRVRYDPAGSVELHTLETVTVPLVESQALTATTREQTTILIGNI